MSLTLHSLTLHDFRNYQSFELNDIQPITILVGPNAIGKTNIIEAIQLLTALSSFKGQPLEYIYREGQNQGLCKAEFIDENKDRKIELSLIVKKGQRIYKQNGKNKKPSELTGLAPSVTFTPDDLELIKGSQTKKRATIDVLGCQLSKNHLLIKKDFEAIIKQKNKALKEEEAPDFIESLNEVLIKTAAQLTCYRIALLEKLKPYLYKYYNDIAGDNEELIVTYTPSWEVLNKRDSAAHVAAEYIPKISPAQAREHLTTAISRCSLEEKMRHKAIIGSHHDRIDFYINGANAEVFASQGQQRSIVLALKLAEVALIDEILNQRPILLLDDVMSELDAKRRAALISCIKDSMQVFITTTNLQYFDDSLFADITPIFLENA